MHLLRAEDALDLYCAQGYVTGATALAMTCSARPAASCRRYRQRRSKRTIGAQYELHGGGRVPAALAARARARDGASAAGVNRLTSTRSNDKSLPAEFHYYSSTARATDAGRLRGRRQELRRGPLDDLDVDITRAPSWSCPRHGRALSPEVSPLTCRRRTDKKFARPLNAPPHSRLTDSRAASELASVTDGGAHARAARAPAKTSPRATRGLQRPAPASGKPLLATTLTCPLRGPSICTDHLMRRACASRRPAAGPRRHLGQRARRVGLTNLGPTAGLYPDFRNLRTPAVPIRPRAGLAYVRREEIKSQVDVWDRDEVIRTK